MVGLSKTSHVQRAKHSERGGWRHLLNRRCDELVCQNSLIGIDMNPMYISPDKWIVLQ